MHEIIRIKGEQQHSDYHYVKCRDSLNGDCNHAVRFCKICQKDICVNIFDIHGYARKCTKCGQRYTEDKAKEELKNVRK